jgi:hypothetical protein
VKKIIASLTLTLIFIGGTSLGNAVDIPDEQLGNPPTPASAGYSGVNYDDQQTLKRSFSYLESWNSDNFALSGSTPCASADEEPCATSNRIFFETPVSPCSSLVNDDCLVSLEAKNDAGQWVSGSLVETVTPSFPTMGTEALKKYFHPFKGNPSRGIPNPGSPSIWKFPGISHANGDEFLIVPKFNAEMLDNKGQKPIFLDVGIFPITRTQNNSNCFFYSSKECYLRWPFKAESTFRVVIKTHSHLVGWFHGRISGPEISTQVLSDGQTQVSIAGTVVQVPILAVWAKNTDLPKDLNDAIQKEFEERGNQFAGTAAIGGDTKNRALQTVMDDRNMAFDQNSMWRYIQWLKVANDKAYATNSTWSFRSMKETGQFSDCIGTKGLSGMVTTNSNAYLAGPPSFEDGSLTYKVASPHFNSKGEVQVGTYDLAIRSDVARCIYNFSQAPIQATLSIIYDTGEARTATTVVSERDGWLHLSAKNFTYSNPTIKVKLTQEAAPAATPKETPTPSASTTAPVKSTITCVKGKTTKKVSALNPKCPAGYKKK